MKTFEEIKNNKMFVRGDMTHQLQTIIKKMEDKGIIPPETFNNVKGLWVTDEALDGLTAHVYGQYIAARINILAYILESGEEVILFRHSNQLDDYIHPDDEAAMALAASSVYNFKKHTKKELVAISHEAEVAHELQHFKQAREKRLAVTSQYLNDNEIEAYTAQFKYLIEQGYFADGYIAKAKKMAGKKNLANYMACCLLQHANF